MEEIWKDIKEFEGLYQVSNLGRVKALSRTKLQKHYSGRMATHTYPEHIVSQSKFYNKYLKVSLYGTDKAVTSLVHKLVAQAFIPNPNNYPCVNHIDENIYNNCADNLEWCTWSYNNSYGKHTEAMSKIVLQCDLSGNILNVWKSASEAARELGFSKRSVCRWCLNNEIRHNYLWKYK